MINSFKGEYAFLGNFYNRPITYKNLTFKNSEAAFQSEKTEDFNIKKGFTTLSPNEAKRLGRSLKLIENWEEIKDEVMYQVCKAKFTDSNLKEKLLATGNEELMEGNTWHDNYWGDCQCEKCKNKKGKNQLGKTLMRIREELNSTK